MTTQLERLTMRRHLTSQLEAAGIDYRPLSVYIERWLAAWSEWTEARDRVEAQGYVVKDANDRIIKSPHAEARDKAAAEMDKVWAQMVKGGKVSFVDQDAEAARAERNALH